MNVPPASSESLNDPKKGKLGLWASPEVTLAHLFGGGRDGRGHYLPVPGGTGRVPARAGKRPMKNRSIGR